MDFKAYTDSNELIVMADGDGGDSLQKTTFLNVAEMGSDHAISRVEAITKCEVSPGIWVRNPDKIKWYSNPENTSRDQISSMIVWAGFMKQSEMILRQLWQQIKRFGFYQNKYPNHTQPGDAEYVAKTPDFMGPESFTQYFRSLLMCGGLWVLLYPLVYVMALVTDIQIFIGSIVICIKGYRDADFADDDNHLMSLAQVHCSYTDTPFSILAHVIYFKYRPIAGFTDETKTVKLRDTGIKMYGHESALLWKYRSKTGAPPIGQFWIEHIIKKD